MSFKILIEHPPNIDLIDQKFHVRYEPNILYAYGDTIYNPSNVDIPKHLLVHEGIHCERQKMHFSPDAWWDEYINDSRFRLNEEICAHRGEWGWYVKEHKDRNEQTRYLHWMAQRLSGKLYGNLLGTAEAKKRITG